MASKLKLRFYEELSLESALRKKLRAVSRVHLPSGLGPLSEKDLAAFPENNIRNAYVARVKPAKHSLVIPLGAKA
ncbi:MAG TPA: TQO small subunit DoxA domain-containing protein, partial [Pseudobdellovibrionaceae bacterium]|nr:TQO small subunit DoxA domain-containing protein [Pseudobdellovibrionaceae bacterium]